MVLRLAESRRDVVIGNPVPDDRAGAMRLQQTAYPKQPELVGNRRLRDSNQESRVPNAEGAMGQSVQRPDPRWGGQGAERVGEVSHLLVSRRPDSGPGQGFRVDRSVIGWLGHRPLRR